MVQNPDYKPDAKEQYKIDDKGNKINIMDKLIPSTEPLSRADDGAVGVDLEAVQANQLAAHIGQGAFLPEQPESHG